MLIKPGQSASQQFLAHYKKQFSDVSVVGTNDPLRMSTIRCSAIPFCPHNFVHGVASLGMARVLNADGVYYTTVGTAVHEVMQNVLSRHSTDILGNWKCRVCGKRTSLSFYKECCDSSPEYEEIEVDYGGIVGHVDFLFRDKDGNLWVVDFKTCSMSGKDSKKLKPPQSYMEQVLTYVILLRKQYKLPVVGAMLCFIPRDNPNYPTIWEKRMTKVMYDRQVANLKKYKRAHKQALNVSTITGLKKMFETYGTCNGEYCSVCKSSNPFQVLSRAFKSGLKDGHLPISKLIADYTSADD